VNGTINAITANIRVAKHTIIVPVSYMTLAKSESFERPTDGVIPSEENLSNERYAIITKIAIPRKME
jgi:hypothetical protein